VIPGFLVEFVIHSVLGFLDYPETPNSPVVLVDHRDLYCPVDRSVGLPDNLVILVRPESLVVVHPQEDLVNLDFHCTLEIRYFLGFLYALGILEVLSGC
jgi:hypothetical protein